MRYSTSLITLIESAEAATPFCACGKGMITVEHDGELWLECVEHDSERSGLMGRLRSLFGHDRRLLLAREELAA